MGNLTIEDVYSLTKTNLDKFQTVALANNIVVQDWRGVVDFSNQTVNISIEPYQRIYYITELQLINLFTGQVRFDSWAKYFPRFQVLNQCQRFNKLYKFHSYISPQISLVPSGILLYHVPDTIDLDTIDYEYDDDVSLSDFAAHMKAFGIYCEFLPFLSPTESINKSAAQLVDQYRNGVEDLNIHSPITIVNDIDHTKTRQIIDIVKKNLNQFQIMALASKHWREYHGFVDFADLANVALRVRNRGEQSSCRTLKVDYEAKQLHFHTHPISSWYGQIPSRADMQSQYNSDSPRIIISPIGVSIHAMQKSLKLSILQLYTTDVCGNKVLDRVDATTESRNLEILSENYRTFLDLIEYPIMLHSTRLRMYIDAVKRLGLDFYFIPFQAPSLDTITTSQILRKQLKLLGDDPHATHLLTVGKVFIKESPRPTK